jgi:hypothetical protein
METDFCFNTSSYWTLQSSGLYLLRIRVIKVSSLGADIGYPN